MRRNSIILNFLFVFLCVLLKIEANCQFSARSTFIENKGQILDQNNRKNADVRFLLLSQGFNVHLRKGGFSYDVYTVRKFKTSNIDSSTFIHPWVDSDSSVISFHRIDFDFLDINPEYTVETDARSAFYYNYYTTGTPLEGVTNVNTFSKIVYHNFYPGIDLIYETTAEKQFEYSFRITPGGNFQKIKFRISGASPEIQRDGSISLTTEFGNIREIIPESYYIIEKNKTPIEITFTESVDDIFGFSCDSQIDHFDTLLIDPIPERLWGTYFGGEWTDGLNDIVLDASGNIFSCGRSASVSNVATAGAYQTTLSGTIDAIIVNFNTSGGLIWATYFGGSDNEQAQSICIDNDYLIIAGETNSTNNIATPGTFQQTFGGGPISGDAFVEKFNSSGFRIWGTYYGGPEDENVGYTVTNNHIYLCGSTASTSGISSPGSFQPVYGGSITDAFLVKLDANGNRIWGTYYGGSFVDGASYAGILNDTIVFLAGQTASTNNISTPGSFQPVLNGIQDGFIASFDTNGNRRWGTYYGGPNPSGSDFISTGVTKSPDLVYFGGWTNSLTNISTPGTFQPTFGGGSDDGYIVKFDPTGNRIWGTYFGGPGVDLINDIALDDSNFIVVTGETTSLTGISTPGSYQNAFAGGLYDSFFGKIDPLGNRIWSTYYGGTGTPNRELSLVALKENQIYLCGLTDSPDNFASPGAFKTQLDVTDGFLARFCFPPDSASLISGPVDVCANSSSIVYSVLPIPWSQSYVWNIPAGVSLVAGQHTNSITLDFGSFATSGYVSVRGVNDCGPGDSSYLYVNMHPRPVPIITGPDSSCVQSIEIYFTQPGKSNYQWNFSSGGQQISGGTGFDDFIQIKWINSGTQWVEVNYTDINNCNASAPIHFPVDVAVGTPVDVSISESQNNVCPGTLVSFLATPTNPSFTPFYQWKVNGVNVGINSPNFSYPPLNGDQIVCMLTSSNTICTSNNPATSNTITMVVNPLMPVNITVSPSSNPVCTGIPVIFTAVPFNGGITPQYQWKVNGLIVGTNSPGYSYVPVNGDAITCTLTSNVLCPSGNHAISNTLTMLVNPILPVGVTIIASSNPFCLGSTVTFTATPINGGPIPGYQWKVNGINAGTNNSVFAYLPVNGDVVTCSLSSSEICNSGNPAQSNPIAMAVNANLPAGITISASSNPFCPGSAVTFIASPLNGGSTPSYQWKVNGINNGSNSSTFIYNPVNNDSIHCIVTSNLSCVIGNPVSSAMIIMIGSLAPNVTFSACFDTVTTVNAKPFRLKGGLPIGGNYSGPGVNSSTGWFTPSVAGIGVKAIHYSYVNVHDCGASMSQSIVVQPYSLFSCGNNYVDTRDNKVYPSVQIGTQCWMTANLNYGSTIPSSQVQYDNCISEKYCYNDLAGNCTKYGGLYQWDEVMKYDDTPAGQGLCPPGWHVPTESEWTILFNYYISNALAGKPLQDTIISGFKAQTSGVFYLNSSWSFNGFATLFWSSTPWSAKKGISHGMNVYDYSVSMYPSSRANAFPIRCLYD